MNAPITKRITSKATTNVIAETCVIAQIVISCSNAGSAWTIEIRDKATAPNTWVPAFTLSVPTDGKPVIFRFEFPLYMQGGVDIVTAGTTAGEVSVQMI